MNFPDDARWDRIEKLAEEIGRLAPEEVSERLSRLAGSGESPTVLTFLGSWLSLPPLPSALSVGTLLGERYMLREKLGEGGMGTVWRATQALIDRDVAVKTIHPSLVTPALQARFVGEMKILGQLSHPGIVRIFDAGMHHQADGLVVPFFAMELIDGEPLDRWVAARRPQRIEIIRMVCEICAALRSAHERQIVHRDLKPSNIIVRNNGQPVIVDFGIARLRGFVVGEEEGLFSGTPRYAAPEQHLGRDHDFRSGESVDIYAVGAILFELVSGRKLFEPQRASIAEMRRAVLESPVPRLSEVIEDCPAGLEEVVGRALRRDPADRFYSVAGLGRAIDRVATLTTAPQAALPRWSPQPRAIIPGTTWVLTEKIGEGGAGEVWLGIHKQLEERRVFKFCDTEEKARTLKREVTLFRLLKERVGRNPHFVTLHEVSLDEPPWYLMMDYVDARELEAWCIAQPGGLEALPESTRLEIVIQAAEALQAAHEAGILHRDIKPANLLVRNDASGLHLFVADFGIGQIVTDQLLRDRTRLGFTRTVSNLRTDRLSGTLLYLAPEVLEGAPATARSDIYSLGVVLWQLLVGQLHAALDPSDWPARIEDPILREFLRRCLAGVPEKRWASAGELAAALRSLPERRAAEERRLAEMKALERGAYRRGILRTAGVAAAIIIVIAGLAVVALIQRGAAERARGEIALDQARAVARSDLTAGRRERGMRLLDLAAKTGTNRAALRTAAASVFALSDLIKLPLSESAAVSNAPTKIPKQSGEVLRALSNDGRVLAIARNVDGLNGAIDLYDLTSSARRLTVTRGDFPWVPIAEAGMLSFSPDNSVLAIGGAASSHHVVLFDTTNGALRAYVFQGPDPLGCAWHPGGRLIATGGADGSIRIWDIAAAASPTQNAPTGNQFDLPPSLDVPALDVPLHALPGQLGPVRHLAFGGDGRWLAALDDARYLRVFSGFPATCSSPGFDARKKDDFANHLGTPPVVTVETRIDRNEQVSAILATSDSIVITYEAGAPEQFRLMHASLSQELRLAPDLARLAWNDAGSELCAISLTDSYWLRSSPLEVFSYQHGNNPVGVSWNGRNGSWLLPAEDRLVEVRPTNAVVRLDKSAGFPLAEAVKGQASLTAIATARDGRVAVYRGRRIQFFFDNAAAPLSSSVLADGGDGRFQDLIWDEGGRLLNALFISPKNGVRIESWRTSSDFPPKCEALPAVSIDSDAFATANDGRNLIVRSASSGLFLFDPASRARVTLGGTVATRRNAPLACSADGRFLATAIEPNTIRLLKVPSGQLFADLPRPSGSAGVTALRWDRAGSQLAGLTEDGRVQVWNLSPWHQWLSAHGMDK